MAIVDEKYKHSALTGRIIKAALTVHGELGTGFQEVIYQKALAIEMQEALISFQRECEISIHYKGRK
jgi:GxxExxY protein